MSSLAISAAAPPSVDSYMKRALVTGAAPLPMVELNNHIPEIGPIVLDSGGAYSLTVYSGPSMHFAVSAKLGRLVDASA